MGQRLSEASLDTCWQLDEPATQRYVVYIHVGRILIIVEVFLVYELYCQHIAGVPLAQRHVDLTAGSSSCGDVTAQGQHIGL